jgi:hypothetical protein
MMTEIKYYDTINVFSDGSMEEEVSLAEQIAEERFSA